MKTTAANLRAPHRGDTQLIRHGGGAHWQARDGMVIRLAAPEPGREPRRALPVRAGAAWPLTLKNALGW
jgi:hypothetical protein